MYMHRFTTGQKIWTKHVGLGLLSEPQAVEWAIGPQAAGWAMICRMHSRPAFSNTLSEVSTEPWASSGEVLASKY